jgi:hypothetical protein
MAETKAKAPIVGKMGQKEKERASSVKAKVKILVKIIIRFETKSSSSTDHKDCRIKGKEKRATSTAKTHPAGLVLQIKEKIKKEETKVNKSPTALAALISWIVLIAAIL